MKKSIFKLFAISSIALFSFTNSNAQCGSSCGSHATIQTTETKTETGKLNSTFKVYGKCTMCKARIELAVNKISGIKSADWDVNTKMLTITYDEEISINEVHRAVAKAGHDTDIIRADDDAYASLSGCCKYERKS
ncbi:MAG: heavy-metal-associated domain-containing protein [Chlorobi bacterium]|nr:heavy-metal-associated domain-containing protein [Chlorobiota bacterium]